ncbi:hypothetical protein TeGR_g547, partial [Tetraparma gracilis]
MSAAPAISCPLSLLPTDALRHVLSYVPPQAAAGCWLVAALPRGDTRREDLAADVHAMRPRGANDRLIVKRQEPFGLRRAKLREWHELEGAALRREEGYTWGEQQRRFGCDRFEYDPRDPATTEEQLAREAEERAEELREKAEKARLAVEAGGGGG